MVTRARGILIGLHFEFTSNTLVAYPRYYLPVFNSSDEELRKEDGVPLPYLAV